MQKEKPANIRGPDARLVLVFRFADSILPPDRCSPQLAWNNLVFERPGRFSLVQAVSANGASKQGSPLDFVI